MCVKGSGSSHEVPAVNIKVEKKTPQELADEELKLYKENLTEKFSELTSVIASLQVLKTEALRDAMTANIAEAAGKLVIALSTLQKGIEKVMVAKREEWEKEDKKIMKMMSTGKTLMGRVSSLNEWAKRLGVKISTGANSSGAKRRRL